jgi:FMN-dependent NADH-azoreductase
VAEAFLAAYRTLHPADAVDTLDLFAEELPAFDGLAVQAKYTILHGQAHSAAEAAAWRAVEAVIVRFKAADRYVLAVPMWNFGIPYRLKHYLDLIIQPGYTFSFSPATGYSGLLTGRRALIVYATGGEYGPGSGAEGYDQQAPYLRQALGFMGITDLREIRVAPTLGPAAAAAESAAREEAVAAARDF